MKTLLFFLVFFVNLMSTTQAWSVLEVSVTRGALAPTPLVMSAGGGSAAPEVSQLVLKDLTSSGVFSVASGYGPHAQELSSADLSLWASRSRANLLCNLTVATSGSRMTVNCQVYDLVKRTRVLSFALVNKAQKWRHISHQVSDRLYEFVTGLKGYFDSQIVYVACIGQGSNRSFRLGIMDADGGNNRYVRHFNTLLKMPYLDVNKDRVFYIRNDPRDTNRMFMLDLYWNVERPVKTPGDVFSIRPVWGTDKLILALRHKDSVRGNLDQSSIGIFETSTRRFQYLLSPSSSIYVSPTGSDSKGMVVFNSDHEGLPRLYEMPLRGGWMRSFSQSDARYYSPMMSRNRGHVVFVKKDMFGFHVAVNKGDGTPEKILATFDWAENPCWSPHESAVVFVARRGRRSPIQMYRLDMNSLKVVHLSTPCEVLEPFWASKQS